MIGRNIRSAQRYNASGEATEQAELPENFKATPQPSSPLAANLAPPTDHLSFFPGQPNAVVRRWPRMDGLRYLYASGMTRMTPRHLGANAIPRPESSAYQQNSHGPIHDAGFYDRYFETGTLPNGIGWPGRANLGLSFKVPKVDRNTAASSPLSSATRMTGPRSARPASTKIIPVKRVAGEIPGEQ